MWLLLNLAAQLIPWDNVCLIVAPQNPQPPALGQAAPVDVCYFCEKKVYLVEKCAAEGIHFHRGCFRCYFCGTNLRLGAYTFQRGENDKGRLGCAHELLKSRKRVTFLGFVAEKMTIID